MAYTAVIEKVRVNRQNPNLYEVTVKCTINNGTSDVFEKEYSTRYNPSNSIDDAMAILRDEFKDDWDKWVAENSLYDSSQFDTAISTLQTQAAAYINQ